MLKVFCPGFVRLPVELFQLLLFGAAIILEGHESIDVDLDATILAVGFDFFRVFQNVLAI